MSNWSWQEHLTQAVSRVDRLAILGVGNELRGDDAAGVLVARALRDTIEGSASLLIADAGSMPEDVTGRLRDFQPELVIVIDAARMDAEPGTIRFLDWRASGHSDANAHALPLGAFARSLCNEIHCNVALIGIQPANTTLFAPVSVAVSEAVRQVIRELLARIAWS